MSSYPPEALSHSKVKEVVLGCDTPAIRKEYREALGASVDLFITRAYHCSLGGYYMFKFADTERRRQYVASYLWNALNNLIASTYLLLSGYLVPSGNLMRHFVESCAMAHVVADPQTMPHLDALKKYDPCKAVNNLRKPKIAARARIDKAGWEEVYDKVYRRYSDYSHASAIAVNAGTLNSETGERCIGGMFDASRISLYQVELQMRLEASERLFTSMELFCNDWVPEDHREAIRAKRDRGE